MTTIARRLDTHFAACAAVAAGAVAVSGTESANAAIVWSGPVNINIPSTTAGVYLNVVTGVNGTAAGTPGWDVNPWSSSGLNMFSQTGGGHVTTGLLSQYDNMTAGTLISPASTFGNTGTQVINPATPLNLNSSNNLIGFRFQNEANGNAIHYGWMRIALSASSFSQPRAIVEYAYENQAGVGILAGQVPAPGALALLGLAGLTAGRRRRN